MPREPTPGLSEIPAGTRLFLDANIFIYHFTGTSLECTRLLERCEEGVITAFTGLHTILEVSYRLMMVEAVLRGLVTPGNVAQKLREHPEVVRKLHLYQDQVKAILEMGIEVVPVSPAHVELSFLYRKEYGLLVNDSLTLALAEELGVEGVATADRDLLRLRSRCSLTFYAPKDLPQEAAGLH